MLLTNETKLAIKSMPDLSFPINFYFAKRNLNNFEEYYIYRENNREQLSGVATILKVFFLEHLWP